MALGQDAQPVALEDPADRLLLELVSFRWDEEVRDGEVRVVGAVADAVGPDRARDVGQDPGAVTLAVDGARAVVEADEAVEREVEQLARRPAVLAGDGDERAGVVLLGARLLDQLPSSVYEETSLFWEVLSDR